MNDRSEALHHEHIKSHFCNVRCVSWSAIIIGAIIAISLSFLLNLLALGIGFSAFPANATTSQTAFAIWGFVGLVIFAILAMFPAGWVAGYLGRAHCLRRKRMGEVYGFGTWGIALIVSILLSSSIGHFLSQTTFLIGRDATTFKITNEVNNISYQPVATPEPAANINVNPKTASETLGIATFATFFIFFIGLISCCFGGRLGMGHCHKTVLDSNYCPHCKC